MERRFIYEGCPMIQRRSFMIAAAATIAATRFARATGVFEDKTFMVVRKGEDIGRHAIRFEQHGDAVDVTTAIDIKVKMAFITLASFKQDAVETWQDGRLVKGKSRIVDGSSVSDVSLALDGSELIVEGPKGPVKASVGTMTDISFWNQDIVRQPILIDTQTTDLIRMTAGDGGVKEMVDLGSGRSAEGTRYQLTGSQGRSGFVWYDAQGRFMRTSFTTRGEQFDYYPI